MATLLTSNNDFIMDKIRVNLETLAGLRNTKIKDIEFSTLKCDGYKKDNVFPNESEPWKPFAVGSRIEGIDEHYWLHFTLDAVPATQDKELLFTLTTGREGEWDSLNPQGLVFLNGKTVQALDVNHTWVSLEFDTCYDVYIYFYTGMEAGLFDIKPQLELRDTLVNQLYYDIKIPYDTLNIIDNNSYDYIKTKDALNKALLLLDYRNTNSSEFYSSIKATISYLKEEFYEKICGASEAVVSCIGHTHIDVAWLWSVRQTREKAERSFSTVLNLMRHYPDYKFMSSQPQLYQYVKESNPEMYAEIKERVKEGRWEVEGAMWLEADCNLISGESMVRQILHGKRFMKREFDVDSTILWLPDVFGYSVALPQILKKSGVNKFFTSKIAWNESNSMPHDTFIWKGIDGTEIFTSFIDTYVKMLDPKEIHKTWDIYKDKSLTNKTLVTFGYGDGGGGSTPEMMENYARLKYGLPGMPKAKIETAGEFFTSIEMDFEKNTSELRNTPKWTGELYLEMHRGTYTSIAKNKKNNRKSEILQLEAETLSVMDMVLFGKKYDSETFEKNQFNILLNQFHDIIPGSSIKEVYDVTDIEYARILSEGRNIADEKLNSLCQNIKSGGGIFVYNPSPYSASSTVTIDEKTYYAKDIPAHGYKVIEDSETDLGIVIEDKKIENEYISVIFDDNYQIISVFDKEVGREVISEKSVANSFEIYEDYPKAFDAWEISNYYKQKMWICDDVQKTEKTARGLRITRHYGTSIIVQEICLNKNSKRIDFNTSIDWHEDHVLLKVAFPLDIHTEKAVYDTQFGNIERPTHKSTPWDEAKFEVCGHKWGDLSEHGYGVSMLNDCKYGYSTEENVLSLSLLKCATYPNPEADRGMHTFTYSLYPHIGDFREGNTVQEAFLLNNPLEAKMIEKKNGLLDDTYAIVSCDSENIVVETIKKAEDDDSIIVRLYDCYNMKSTPKIQFGFDFREVYLCNLLEENLSIVASDGKSVSIPVGNYEIITLKLVR